MNTKIYVLGFITPLVLQCASGPKINRPLEIQEVKNKVELMVDSTDESRYAEDVREAEKLADVFYETKTFHGLGKQKYLVIALGNIRDSKIVSVRESVLNFAKIILYGEIDSVTALENIKSSLNKFSSEKYSPYKKVWFFTKNEVEIEIYESPLSSDSILLFGGGKKYLVKNDTETTIIELHVGYIQDIPDRSLMHIRSSSISETPNVIDIYQFLTTKYNLDIQYLMTKNKELYQLVFDHGNNKNILIHKIMD